MAIENETRDKLGRDKNVIGATTHYSVATMINTLHFELRVAYTVETLNSNARIRQQKQEIILC